MIIKRIKNNTKVFSIIKKMKKLYYIICSKYRKFKKPKILYLLKKHLVSLLFAASVKIKVEKYLKKKGQLIIQKSIKIYNHVLRKHKSRNQTEKIGDIKNCLIEEINQNELISKKHKKFVKF